MGRHSERSEESRLSVVLPVPVLHVDIIPSMNGDPSSSFLVLKMTANRFKEITTSFAKANSS
jgi:hypothetical protein